MTAAPFAALRGDPTLRVGVAGTAVVALAAVVAASTVVVGEVALVEAANGLPAPVIDALEVVMQLGARGAIPLVALVAAALADRRRLRVALAVAVAGLAAWWGASLVKDAVERPRPAGVGGEVVVHDPAAGHGFPSSHTSVATALVVAAALATRRPAAAALAVGAVVGVARMAVGVHLPLDVLGGLGLGATAAALAVFFALR